MLQNDRERNYARGYAKGFAIGFIGTLINGVGDGLITAEQAINELNGVLDDYEKMIISIERFGAIIVDLDDIKSDA